MEGKDKVVVRRPKPASGTLVIVVDSRLEGGHGVLEDTE